MTATAKIPRARTVDNLQLTMIDRHTNDPNSEMMMSMRKPMKQGRAQLEKNGNEAEMGGRKREPCTIVVTVVPLYMQRCSSSNQMLCCDASLAALDTWM